jgi:DinB superfamily
MKEQLELFIKSALISWYAQIKRADNLFNTLSDEQLGNEVSSGRNRGIYLLGHLTAIHDNMLPLFNFREQLYPELKEIFIDNPDKSFKELPPISELKLKWKAVNSALAENFESLTTQDWFQKHNSVSEADFAKEPTRNRLNVLLGRTNHIAYHTGQIAFLQTK